MQTIDDLTSSLSISSQLIKRKVLVLFFIQLFAALTYSVLYSTLIFYTTKKLHLSDSHAISIIASFIAYNYALHLLGGYLGGRWLSYRSLYCMSIIMVVLGGLIIAIPTIDKLYWGLAIFLSGAGTSVTSLNCMVTQLFTPNDHRREAAFLLIYTGMSIGLFLGYSISGYYQLQANYQRLFLLSSLGTSIALLILITNWKHFPDRATLFMKLSKTGKITAAFVCITLILALAPVLYLLLHHSTLSNRFVLIAGTAMLFIIAVLALRQSCFISRCKMFAYLILSVGGIIFWSLYLMMPMGLNLFIARNMDRHILGILVAPQWIQNFNTLIIIITGPILAWSFKKLRRYNFNITEPVQFSCALLLIGIAFIILTIGIHHANVQGLTSIQWLLISCCFYSLGELFISPIGYSMIGRLAPANLQSIMMGNWMMMTGVAATLSSYFSHRILNVQAVKDPLQTNPLFTHNFSLLGGTAVTSGLILLSLIPFLNRLIYSKSPAP